MILTGRESAESSRRGGTSLIVCVCMYVCISLYRWRLFRRPILSQPDRVVTYTKAAIALHNYLRTKASSVYCPPGLTDGEDGERNVIEGAWRTDEEQSTGMGHVACTSSNRYVIIGERAKRARHSHVCSIENRGYIYYILLCIVRAKFCSYNP